MKLLIAGSLLFFINISLLANNPGDSLDVKNTEKEKVTRNEPQQENSQLGEKSNARLQKGKKKIDVFIDKDGDGICDHRASGMGFDKMRKRNKAGQKGNGKGGNGNGGQGGK